MTFLIYANNVCSGGGDSSGELLFGFAMMRYEISYEKCLELRKSIVTWYNESVQSNYD